MMIAPAGSSNVGAAIARVAATFHGVRYVVADVQRACDFYTTHLGFDLEHQHLPEFATVALGPLKIHLSGPGASGSRLLPGGEQQSPGGSTRVVLRVKDLPAVIEALRSAGATFRNDMETGPAGRQIQCLIRTATRSSCSSRHTRHECGVDGRDCAVYPRTNRASAFCTIALNRG
jgi:glyoxylase I family protein